MVETPKILHLMCHGGYDINKNAFFLAVEDENANLY